MRFIRPVVIAAMAVVLIAMASTVMSCSSGLPSTNPSITGTITEITSVPGGATLLVTGTGTQKSSVEVSATTEIFVDTGTGIETGTLTDVVTGASVQVWFSGPVTQTYPVQGRAQSILVKP
jgi:hypothetical protein